MFGNNKNPPILTRSLHCNSKNFCILFRRRNYEKPNCILNMERHSQIRLPYKLLPACEKYPDLVQSNTESFSLKQLTSVALSKFLEWRAVHGIIDYFRELACFGCQSKNVEYESRKYWGEERHWKVGRKLALFTLT